LKKSAVVVGVLALIMAFVSLYSFLFPGSALLQGINTGLVPLGNPFLMVSFFAFSVICFSFGFSDGKKADQNFQPESITDTASKKKARKRIKVKGHYMQVRQRSTKRGKKGTIMGKWKPKSKKEDT